VSSHVRRYEQERLERARWLYARICEGPGRTIRQIERDAGVRSGSLYALLTGLGKHGFIVYEDDDGGLFPLFCERPSKCATLF